MKGRRFIGAVVCAAVVLGLAAAASAAEPAGKGDFKVVKVIKQKSDDGASRAWLGVQLQDVSRSVSRAMGLKTTEGALVGEVVDGSPADEAGLQDGDVITNFEGDRVRNAADLTGKVRGQRPGTSVTLTVMRDGESRKLHVTLGDLADQKGQGGDDEEDNDNGDDNGNVWYWKSPGNGDGDGSGNQQMRIFRMHANGAYLGVELQSLTDQLGEFFGIKDGKGALISRVVEDSPAEAAGLKAGDVITKVGDEEIGDPSDVTGQIGDLKPGDSVSVTYVGDRGRNENTVTVKLAKRPAGQNQRMMMLDGNGDLPDMRELRQIPGMRRHLQGMDAAPGMPADPNRQQMRRQMEELREQMQQLRDQLQEMRDQLHEQSQK